MKIKLSHFVLIFFLSFSGVYGQFIADSFPIRRSNLIEQVNQKKKQNPKISAKELAEFANSLVAGNGLNYEFGLSPKVCKLVEERKRSFKAGESTAVSGRARFRQETGSEVGIRFADVVTGKGACGECFVEAPLAAATEKDFIILIQGKNIKLQFSSDVIVEEAALVDNQDLNKEIRRWKMPYQTVPLGVSDDGEILYLNLPDKELNELVLMIFDSGVFSFAARSDLGIAKPEILKDFPKDPNNSYLSFISFGSGKNKRTLRFSAPCT